MESTANIRMWSFKISEAESSRVLKQSHPTCLDRSSHLRVFLSATFVSKHWQRVNGSRKGPHYVDCSHDGTVPQLSGHLTLYEEA